VLTCLPCLSGLFEGSIKSEVGEPYFVRVSAPFSSLEVVQSLRESFAVGHADACRS
jgi:hypothetical protein